MQSLKEIVIDIPEQSAVSLGRCRSVGKIVVIIGLTKSLWMNKLIFSSPHTDNVTLQIDGVLYLRILDPFKVCW